MIWCDQKLAINIDETHPFFNAAKMMKRKICHTGDWEDCGTWNLYVVLEIFQSTGVIFHVPLGSTVRGWKEDSCTFRVLEVWLSFSGVDVGRHLWSNMGKSKWCQSAEGKNHDKTMIFFGVSHGVFRRFSEKSTCLWDVAVHDLSKQVMKFRNLQGIHSIWIFSDMAFLNFQNLPKKNPQPWMGRRKSFRFIVFLLWKSSYQRMNSWTLEAGNLGFDRRSLSIAQTWGPCRYHNYGIALVNRLYI